VEVLAEQQGRLMQHRAAMACNSGAWADLRH
jgi:hypothetical protein